MLLEDLGVDDRKKHNLDAVRRYGAKNDLLAAIVPGALDAICGRGGCRRRTRRFAGS
jgi:hypothetical protein